MILQHPKTKTRNMRREAIWKNQNLTNQNLVILKKRWCEPPPNGGCQKFSFQNRFHKQEHVVIPDFVFIIQIVFFFVFQGICEHFWAFEQEQMTILNNEEKASSTRLGGPRNNCLTKCKAYLSVQWKIWVYLLVSLLPSCRLFVPLSRVLQKISKGFLCFCWK